MNRNLSPDEFEGYPEPTGLSEDRVSSRLQPWDVGVDDMLDVYEAADAVEPRVGTVPLAGLSAYQRDVERPSLDHLVQHGDFDRMPPIEVVKHGPVMAVRDGSHRANAAIVRGMKDIHAQVREIGP